MSNKQSKAGELKFPSLIERLLLAAYDNIAYTLRPYPEDVKPEDLEGAINALRLRGLVQGMEREPNLTREGVEAAEKLAARSKKKPEEKADPNAKAGEGTDNGGAGGDGTGDGTQP